MIYSSLLAGRILMAGIMNFVGDALPEEYAPSLPCVYADGVMSAAWAPSNAKIYLYRVDSPTLGKEGAASVPVVQIVMPIEGFAAAAQFMVQRLLVLKDRQALRKQALTEIKRLCEEGLRE